MTENHHARIILDLPEVDAEEVAATIRWVVNATKRDIPGLTATEEVLPDFDTVELAGLDGTLRDGSHPYTWEQVARAALTREVYVLSFDSDDHYECTLHANASETYAHLVELAGRYFPDVPIDDELQDLIESLQDVGVETNVTVTALA